jgi:hypothetical protein
VRVVSCLVSCTLALLDAEQVAEAIQSFALQATPRLQITSPGKPCSLNTVSQRGLANFSQVVGSLCQVSSAQALAQASCTSKDTIQYGSYTDASTSRHDACRQEQRHKVHAAAARSCCPKELIQRTSYLIVSITSTCQEHPYPNVIQPMQ